MPAKPPILDERTLKEVLRKLQALAAINVPEWTPPAEGDAGTMIQRIFARLTEIALNQLNEVPEKNLLAFLDTMGVSLLSPSPAKAPLTFTLTPGARATLVPQSSQANTKASAQQPAIIFETESDLTVIPATLATGFTIDPTWDRYTDQALALGGQQSFGLTPFVGTKRMPHILYLGNELLLDVAGSPDFESGGEEGIPNASLTFRWQSSRPQSEVRDFLERLSLQVRRQGTIVPISRFDVIFDKDGFNFDIVSLVNIGILGPIDLETIEGIGLVSHVKRRWLRVVLPVPFPDDPVAQDLRLTFPRMTIGARDLTPDFAFSNNSALDLSKDFFPFGETPKIGDTFYLAQHEAFSKSGSKATISFKVRPLPPPKLVWEHFDSQQKKWVPFTVLSGPPDSADFQEAPFSYIVDGTSGFTKTGQIVAGALQMGSTVVNGVTAFWVRVRVTEGVFRLPPVIASLTVPVSVSPPPVTPGPVIPGPVIPGPVLPGPVLPGPVLPGPVLPGPVLPGPVTPGPISSAIIPIIHSRPVEFGFSNDTRINDLGRDFLPFSNLAGTGDTFYFGETSFPFIRFKDTLLLSIITVNVLLDPNSSDTPPATLVWEYFGAKGWAVVPSVIDKTRALTRGLETPPFSEHTVTLLSVGSVEKEVNGKLGHWVRVWITDGGYGRPAEFVPIDPDDPKQGFKLKRGTGNLQPPQLQSLSIEYEASGSFNVITQNGFLYKDQAVGSDLIPFVSVKNLTPGIYADAEPAFYLGFDAAFPEEAVTLYVDVEPRAFAGSVIKEARSAPAPSSALPPLQWEYFNGIAWRELTVFDGTNNFTESGTVSFLTPPDFASLARFDLTKRYWIRARSTRNDPVDTQNLRGVYLNTVPAIQAVTVQNEILGSSNGQPNQTLRFARLPVLLEQQVVIIEPEPPSDNERAGIEKEEGKDAVQNRVNPVTGETELLVRWHQIDTFLLSLPHNRHYLLDHTTGEIKFGDGKRGMVPPPGTNNIIALYRSGGGTAGNVPPSTVVQVKSSLAGVGSVTNPALADGGAQVETLPMVIERGPQTLRHRNHAVASSDLEYLARQAAGTRVARAKCLPNVNRDLRFEPGWVTLILVPSGSEAKLFPSSELISEVEDYIGARDFVGLAQQTPARVNVIGSGYIQVSVTAEIVPQSINRAEQVKRQTLTAIADFLHPLRGGPDATGWEFGRDVYASEVYQIIEGIPGVDHVESLRLIPNIAQHRLTFTTGPAPAMDFPEGSIIRRLHNKAALLAEKVPASISVERITIKGFKEGDRVTMVGDLSVNSTSDQANRLPVTPNKISVSLFSGMQPPSGFPRGCLVTNFDGTQRTRLRRAITRKLPITEIEVEDATFASRLNPNETLTVFYPFPMTVTSVTMALLTLTVESTSSGQINVSPFDSDATPIPSGTIVTTRDGMRRTRLAASIPANQKGAIRINVEDPSFTALLEPGDLIDVHVPAQTLGVEPYETEISFPEGTVLATLDNRVRLPLSANLSANQTITRVGLADFFSGEEISINRRDNKTAPLTLTTGDVEPIGDIVYLDDNFLVYSGLHHITMIVDANE